MYLDKILLPYNFCRRSGMVEMLLFAFFLSLRYNTALQIINTYMSLLGVRNWCFWYIIFISVYEILEKRSEVGSNCFRQVPLHLVNPGLLVFPLFCIHNVRVMEVGLLINWTVQSPVTWQHTCTLYTRIEVTFRLGILLVMEIKLLHNISYCCKFSKKNEIKDKNKSN
jgi:hypothetical protein